MCVVVGRSKYELRDDRVFDVPAHTAIAIEIERAFGHQRRTQRGHRRGLGEPAGRYGGVVCLSLAPFSRCAESSAPTQSESNKLQPAPFKLRLLQALQQDRRQQTDRLGCDIDCDLYRQPRVSRCPVIASVIR